MEHQNDKGVVRRSSPELVVDAIKRGVLMGRFVPGQRLIEADLTREIGVSRGPVREALKLLAAEGIVALSPHRGAYIRALSHAEVDDLIDVLEVLVGFSVRRAAERIGENDNRAMLIEAFKRLEKHGPHGDRALLAVDRTAFYDRLFRIAGNREMTRINPVIPTQILRLQIHPYLTAEERELQFADYGALVEAVLSGDGRAAQRVFERHINRSRVHARNLPPDALPAGNPEDGNGDRRPAAKPGRAPARDATYRPKPPRRPGAGQRPSR
ncbi:MAG: GntR family transcriptional regulator [Steroidobacteraceae bacterium]|nr:GntR family transcriptional regulator [Steroidobacteraceae bacterium]